jgi:hypothetical protein
MSATASALVATMKALVLPGVQAGIGPFESGWILSSM